MPATLGPCVSVGLAAAEGVGDAERVAPWLADGVQLDEVLADGVAPSLGDTLGETLGVGVTVSTIEVVCEDVAAVEAL